MNEDELFELMMANRKASQEPTSPAKMIGGSLLGAGLAGAAGAALLSGGRALSRRRTGGPSGAATAVLSGAMQAGGRALRGGADDAPAPGAMRPPPAQGASDFLTEAGTGLSRVTPEGARIQQNLDTARGAATWDRTPVPHRTTIAEARRAAETAGLDPTKITERTTRSHSPAEVLGKAQRIQQETDEMLSLSAQVSRGADADGNPLSPNALEQIEGRINILTESINNEAAALGEAGTEAGRQLNIFRLLARRGPPQENRPAWLVQAQKVKGTPLTDTELADLNRLIDSGDTKELSYQVGRLRPQGNVQRAVELFRSVLLTNPPPHIANIMGNAAVAGFREASDVVGYGIDRMIAKVVPNAVEATKVAPTLTRYKRQAEASREAAKEAANLLGLTRASREPFKQGEGARAGLRAWAERIRRGAVSEEDLRKMDFRQTHFENPALDVLAKGAYVGMEASDRIFRAPAFAGSMLDQATTLAAREGLRGQALRNRALELIDAPTPEMVTQALVDAERAVFMEQGNVARVVNQFRGSLGPMGHLLMPFTTFASNVAERSITELSPIGTMRGAAKIARIAMGAVPEGQIAEQQRQAVNLLAQSTVASGGPVLLGYLLAQNGLMTGPGMTAERRAYYDATGGRANAIKVGDTYYGIDRLAPIASLMMVGAAMHEVQENSELSGVDSAIGTLGAAAAVPTELSPVQGIRNLLDIISVSDGSGGVRGSRAGRVVGSIVGSAVAPPVVARAARALDDRERLAETFGERLQARIPIARQRLPERMDVLGTPVPARGGLSAFGITNPVESRTEGAPVRQELERLNVGMRPPARRDGESVGEYSMRASIYGAQAESDLLRAMSTMEYLNSTDEERKEILRRTLSTSRGRLTRLAGGR